MGAWKTAPVVAIVSVISIVVTAAYILLVVRRVFFGEIPEKIQPGLSDISFLDKIVVITLSLIMILIGLIPSLLSPLIESGVRHILALVGGAS
jgi:NADH-quinone oxidoreductase subunit M